MRGLYNWVNETEINFWQTKNYSLCFISRKLAATFYAYKQKYELHLYANVLAVSLVKNIFIFKKDLKQI